MQEMKKQVHAATNSGTILRMGKNIFYLFFPDWPEASADADVMIPIRVGGGCASPHTADSHNRAGGGT
jgi:hypothetical protein